ncbi:MAG: efflux RND transporter periplasmic adaptor subunit [Alphaproteobacteria bacterium]
MPVGMNRKYQIAGAIAVVILAWVAAGLFMGKPSPKKGPEKAAASEIPQVRVETIKAVMHQAELVVRGRTQAMRAVDVRSETTGQVADLPTEKGTIVKAGDPLCQLQPEARQAQVAQAQAKFDQAELTYKGSEELAKKGFRSPNQVASDKAARDAALASLQQAQIELARTTMRAPFDGVVDARYVNVGDYMRSGDRCELVVDLDPILILGSASEAEVHGLEVGSTGRAKLASGEELDGRVRFVAKSADPTTRTFAVEIEAANPNHTVRDGVTAAVRIGTRQILAHHFSPAILTLNEEGKVGVRTVENGVVKFVPVQIISDDKDGVWVAGLPETVTVITVGQEFVTDGAKVKAVPAGGQS